MAHPITMAFRALTRRCPNCGGGDMYASWFRARPRCPTCGLKVERGEEGYRVGSYMFNLVGSELVFVATFAAIIIWSWPSPPWETLKWTAGLFMLAAPLLFYPFTKLLFLAFDLSFRPARVEDFADATARRQGDSGVSGDATPYAPRTP